MLHEKWRDLFIIALSGHVSRDIFSFPNLSMSSKSSVRYSLLLVWLQTVHSKGRLIIYRRQQDIVAWGKYQTRGVYCRKINIYIWIECFKDINWCWVAGSNDPERVPVRQAKRVFGFIQDRNQMQVERKWEQNSLKAEWGCRYWQSVQKTEKG